MRLISQDGINGIFDFPYEKCIVYIYSDMKTIKIQPVGEENSQFIVARYSSESKALKVMEMLREQYMKLGMIKILASGTCEYMDKSLGKEEKMKIYEDYCRKHCFKFPADEEVEV